MLCSFYYDNNDPLDNFTTLYCVNISILCKKNFVNLIPHMGSKNFINLLFSVFSEKIQITIQNIAHVNMEAYNHLLWFVCGLHMATAS